MDGVVCAACNTWMPITAESCPGCGTLVIMSGEKKNIIDRIQANCLIHRYEGSDILEPAVVIREGKVNMRVATKLKEYAHPIAVPKHKVFAFDQNLLSSIQALRNERTATICRYDQLIASYWRQLRPHGMEGAAPPPALTHDALHIPAEVH